jgi:hypothetical protein
MFFFLGCVDYDLFGPPTAVKENPGSSPDLDSDAATTEACPPTDYPPAPLDASLGTCEPL